ncbi:MAG: right-handed parallel beta-helix repeat-containing protein [Thermoplasmata archaeon]|nr:MAG: right-handed parallel beta-helix repeat-containing protein [Thermoplasmata archaeon]
MRKGKLLSLVLFGLIMLSIFLFYQEDSRAQGIDYIVLTDAPDGTELTTVVVDIGGQVTAYASGYNTTTGYVDLVEVNWTGGGGIWSPNLGTNSTFTAGGTPGLFKQTVYNSSLGLSDSFDIEISPPSVDYIIIRDQPRNGGNWVGPRTYVQWDVDTFYAAGYNISFGYVGDVKVNWTSSDENVGTVTTNHSQTSFYALGGGTCVVTANYGGGITNDTGILTVYTIDELIIRDGPDGGGEVVFDRTYYVGQTDLFWAAAYNDTFGFLRDMIGEWWSNNTMVAFVDSQENESAFFRAIGPGTCIVNVYINGGLFNNTGIITVKTYDVDYIIIRDSYGNMGSPVEDMLYKIGDTDEYFAAGYNNTVGYVGDVSVNWTSSNPSVGEVNGNDSSTTFRARGPGTCIVSADYGGSITDDTGVITVAKVDSITIVDSYDNEVGDRFYFTWNYGEVFFAVAYNDTHGYLGGVYVTWMSSNDSVGNVSSPGYSTYFDPIADGTCIVTANYGGITDDTGIITVSSATVDYVQIRDAPNGGGNVVTDPYYVLGSVDIYYGALYNRTNGYLCDILSAYPGQDAFWNSSNLSVATITVQGSQAIITCSDTNTGTSVIGIWAFGVWNSTTLTVFSYTIDYISIMDAPGGSGNHIGDKTYSVWDTDTFYAIAFNYTYGYVTDVIASWDSDDTDVGKVTSPGVFTTFTAQWVTTDSTCKVMATYKSFSNTTGTLTVLAPRVDYVQIRSADNGGGAPISSISYQRGAIDVYYGASYNNTVNFIGTVPQTSSWTSTDTSIVEVTSPGNFSAVTCNDTNWGTVTVKLNDGASHIYSTAVTVLFWNVDYILIRDAPNGGGIDLSDPANYPSYPVGHSTTFYGAMYNYSEGYLIDVASTSIWTSSNTDIVEVTTYGVSSSITCSNTNYGTVRISLYEWMGHSATTQVTVQKPTIDYMKIMNAPDGLGDEVGEMLYIIGDPDMFYAAAFNNTAGYFEDVSVSWSSDDESVGTVDPSSGSSTKFTAVGMGTCVVTADYGGGITDTTGTLTVTLPDNITVDDSGGAHFTSIQEAIDNAKDGNTVYVYSGTYFEHLTISKSIILMGEDRDTVIIDGQGYGKVIYLTGDNVRISGFTIQNGEYGIYCDESDSTKITYNIIRDYDYGLYNYRTTGGWITYNKITGGQNGIVTFEAYNDAIRYNEISYNTVYGAKDYDSQLRNCFNWNRFHHNHIAYYYDPDIPLDTLEFDGNTLEDNYIAIMVENASTISITNNIASRNKYGIYLIRASPYIAHNTISDADYGIYCEYSSPTLSNNKISEITNYGIYAEFADSLVVKDNILTDSKMLFVDSTIKELWLKDTTATKVNSVIESYQLDDISGLEDQWFLRVRVVDEEGNPVKDAAVLIYDVFNTVVSSHITDSDGWIEQTPLTVQFQDSTSTVSYNPYRILVTKDSLSAESVISIEENTETVISLESKEVIIKSSEQAFPWALVLLVGFIGAFSLAGLSIEVVKYGLLMLFLPLYSRIKKDKVLDQPTRYKILGYIIGNPGAHFGLIKHDLELGNGQLADHIRQLARAHLIYSKQDGLKKRFYPTGYPKAEIGKTPLSDIQEKIVGIIKRNSGISQKKVASKIGISRQVAGYHLAKLEREGMIEKEMVGRESRYYPSKAMSV